MSLKNTLTSLLAVSLLAALPMTGCIIVTEGGSGEGHHWDDDNWNSDCDPWSHDDCDPFSDESPRRPTPPHVVEPPNEMTPQPTQGEPDEVEEPVEDCPQSFEVCGVDGITYETPCAASRAHVRIERPGVCGTQCVFDSECGEYEQCGERGVCEAFSCENAAQEPVCGDDGVTYPSACDALGHHAGLDYTGECLPPCQADADCDSGSICEANLCVEANCPELAPDDYSQEVCGEDTFTYVTECHARQARVPVLHEGCCVL